MNARMNLVAVILQLGLVSLAAEADRCAQPGAVRCDDDGRHLSVCLERSATWLRARDCAASGLVCAGDRCASTSSADAASARAETCVNGRDTTRCSPECDAVQICLATNVWLSYESCSSVELCDQDSFTCKPVAQANCPQLSNCPDFTGRFPDLSNASRFFDCSEAKAKGAWKICSDQNDGGDFFNACSGKCDYSYDSVDRYPNECTTSNTGYSNHLFSNPALYYVCLNGQASWQKCDLGYFENKLGDCVGKSDYSETCDVLKN